MTPPPQTVEGAGIPTAEVPGEDPGQRSTASQLLLSFQGAITFLAFLTVFAVFAIWLGAGFTSVEARVADIHQNVPVLLLGLAVMVTLIAGQFDLSVASMATLTAFLVVGLPVKSGWPLGLALAACVAVGVLGGLLNGFLVVRLRVNTFIATLGTGGIFSGLAAVYSSGATLNPTADGRQLASWFSGPGSLGDFGAKFPAALTWAAIVVLVVAGVLTARRRRPAQFKQRLWDVLCVGGAAGGVALLFVAGLPEAVQDTSWTIGALLVISVLLWALLSLTTYGRYVHAVGSNAEAARLAGVNAGKETIKAYMLGGTLAALAGVILSASQGSAAPNGAVSFLLPAFAAAFLSTVVLSTGRFTVWGTLIGGTFLVWVSQGLIAGGLETTWTDVVNGALLVGAVSLSMLFRRTVQRISR